MTREPAVVSPNVTLHTALRLMDEVGVRHLPVVEGNKLVGVLSDRDLLEHTGWGWLGQEGAHADRGRDVRVEALMHRDPITAAPDDLIVAAVTELSVHGIGCLPVVEEGRLVGIVSETDFLRLVALLRTQTLAPRELDPEVRTIARGNVATLTQHDTLADAGCLMHDRGIRHVPILDAGGAVRAVVSDRDLRRAHGAGADLARPLGELVQRTAITIDAGHTVSEAARLMAEHRISALPVVGDAHLAIVTTTDVLEHALGALS